MGARAIYAKSVMPGAMSWEAATWVGAGQGARLSGVGGVGLESTGGRREGSEGKRQWTMRHFVWWERRVRGGLEQLQAEAALLGVAHD